MRKALLPSRASMHASRGRGQFPIFTSAGSSAEIERLREESEETNHRGTEDTEGRTQRRKKSFLLCVLPSVSSVPLWFVSSLSSRNRSISAELPADVKMGNCPRPREACMDARDGSNALRIQAA